MNRVLKGFEISWANCPSTSVCVRQMSFGSFYLTWTLGFRTFLTWARMISSYINWLKPQWGDHHGKEEPQSPQLDLHRNIGGMSSDGSLCGGWKIKVNLAHLGDEFNLSWEHVCELECLFLPSIFMFMLLFHSHQGTAAVRRLDTRASTASDKDISMSHAAVSRRATISARLGGAGAGTGESSIFTSILGLAENHLNLLVWEIEDKIR